MLCACCILKNNYNNYGSMALVTYLVVTWHGPSFCHESVITSLRHATYAAPLCAILARDLLSERQMDSVTRSQGVTTTCGWVTVRRSFCACYKSVWASRRVYRDADKSLARPGRKQANVSVRIGRISRPFVLQEKKKNLITARVSIWLKSRASLTCFRAYFLLGRAKDLSAHGYPYVINPYRTNVENRVSS